MSYLEFTVLIYLIISYSTNKYLSKLIEWTNTNQLTVQQKVRVLDQSLEKLKRIEELSSQLVEINKKAS